jgi:hypothetical protein
MNTNEENKFDITQFELLETDGDILKGGYSTSDMGAAWYNKLLDLVGINGQCNTTNNCNGGNCVSGCGG